MLKAAREGNVERIVTLLYPGADIEPPAASIPLKRKVVRTLVEYQDPDDEELWNWSLRCHGRTEPPGRELASLMLEKCYGKHPEEVWGGLLELVEDCDEGVREQATASLGRLFEKNFDSLLPRFRGLTAQSSPEIRRAVVVAAMTAGVRSAPERATPLLDLLEPLLSDPRREVRSLLGRSVLGNRFLTSFPGTTLLALARWTPHPDRFVRWNIAVALSVTRARSHQEAVLKILEVLAFDRDELVSRAVARSLRNFLKGKGSRRARAQIKSWLDRPEVARTASLALVGGRIPSFDKDLEIG